MLLLKVPISYNLRGCILRCYTSTPESSDQCWLRASTLNLKPFLFLFVYLFNAKALCICAFGLNAMMKRLIFPSLSSECSNWKMGNPFCRNMDLMTIPPQELNVPFGFSHARSVPAETFFNPNCSGYEKTFHYSFLSMQLVFSSTRRLSSLRFGWVIKSALLRKQRG